MLGSYGMRHKQGDMGQTIMTHDNIQDICQELPCAQEALPFQTRLLSDREWLLFRWLELLQFNHQSQMAPILTLDPINFTDKGEFGSLHSVLFPCQSTGSFPYCRCLKWKHVCVCISLCVFLSLAC